VGSQKKTKKTKKTIAPDIFMRANNVAKPLAGDPQGQCIYANQRRRFAQSLKPHSFDICYAGRCPAGDIAGQILALMQRTMSSVSIAT
jgi:hypothetical protein